MKQGPKPRQVAVSDKICPYKEKLVDEILASAELDDTGTYEDSPDNVYWKKKKKPKRDEGP